MGVYSISECTPIIVPNRNKKHKNKKNEKQSIRKCRCIKRISGHPH